MLVFTATDEPRNLTTDRLALVLPSRQRRLEPCRSSTATTIATAAWNASPARTAASRLPSVGQRPATASTSRSRPTARRSRSRPRRRCCPPTSTAAPTSTSGATASLRLITDGVSDFPQGRRGAGGRGVDADGREHLLHGRRSGPDRLRAGRPGRTCTTRASAAASCRRRRRTMRSAERHLPGAAAGARRSRRCRAARWCSAAGQRERAGQPAAKPKPKALTRAQKLAAALKACRKKRPRESSGRPAKRQARKRYGPLKAKKAVEGGEEGEMRMRIRTLARASRRLAARGLARRLRRRRGRAPAACL